MKGFKKQMERFDVALAIMRTRYINVYPWLEDNFIAQPSEASQYSTDDLLDYICVYSSV